MKGLFVTGTDTGVGKTTVTAGIARILADQGVDVGVMKPVETGAPGPGWPDDAGLLVQAARSTDPQEDVVPWTFTEPLAPLVAARNEARPVDLDVIERSYERLEDHHTFMLVEGAGGLSVSLTEHIDMADLALRLELPLLIVTRIGLGTLNHTYLTVQYARSKGLAIAGLFVNTPDGHGEDASSPTNPAMLAERCELPVLAVAPYAPAGAGTPEDAAQLVRDSGLDVDSLIDRSTT